MALGVNIVSEFDAKGIRKALAEFKKLEGVGAKSTFALRSIDGAVTNGIKNVAKFGGIAVAGLGAIGFALTQGAMAAQGEQARLATILKRTGAATDSQTKSLIAQAEAIEKVGVASASSIITAQSQLATFDLQFETIQKLTPAITDYVIAEKGASATTEDFKAMTNGLAQALNGQFGALTRSGFVLDKTTKALISNGTEAQRAAAIVGVLNSTYGGFNEATGKTAAGKLVMLKNSFQNLRDEIGDRLIPVFEKLMDFFATTVVAFVQNLITVFDERGLTGVMGEVGTSFHNFISSGGKVKDAILGIAAAVVAFKLIIFAATIAQNLFNVSLLANPIGIVVAAIIAVGVALVAAYIRFEGFRKVVNAVINAIIGYLEHMVNMFIKHINVIIKVINFVIKAANLLGANITPLGELGEVAFGRIGNAADKATNAVRRTAKAIKAESSRYQALADSFKTDDGDGGGGGGGVGSGAAKTVKTAIEKLKEYTDALKGSSNAERALAKAGKDTAAARLDLVNATQKVSDAQAKFNLVTKGYAADSKEATDAMRRLVDAGKRLRDANLSQQDSVRSLAAAERKLADLRALTANPADVADAERKLERSIYSSEEAIFRVAEAEAELAKIRADPKSSAVDIRRAEINLAEAKLSVTDSTIAQRNAESALDKKRNLAASPEEIAEAERELEKAKYAVQDATDAVRDATLEQAVAQALYTEIVDGAKEGSEAYAEALRDLLDAQKNELGASEKLEEQLYREAEAVDTLREAKIALAKLEKEVGANIVRRATNQFNASRPPALTAPGSMVAAANGAGSSTSIVNNISAGMGADAQDIAQVIVDSLRSYERSNGFIPVTAQFAIAV